MKFGMIKLSNYLIISEMILDYMMKHPSTVVHLEHDGRVLLVNSNGQGPQLPVQGRLENGEMMRLPTIEEVSAMEIPWVEMGKTHHNYADTKTTVIKGYPKIEWPENWALKDDLIADNFVHPVAREAIYRSIHRLVSKVIVFNQKNQILMGMVERGHFNGFWTLPGGYMDHNEHPRDGCVREAKEEFGIDVELIDDSPVVSQKIFNRDGISFVSFTYMGKSNAAIEEMTLLENEISEAKWFSIKEAQNIAVSTFDVEALSTLEAN